MGSRERIPYSASLACASFALPIKLSLSQHTSFLTFTLPVLSPSPQGGVSERLHGAELLAGVNPQQYCTTGNPCCALTISSGFLQPQQVSIITSIWALNLANLKWINRL